MHLADPHLGRRLALLVLADLPELRRVNTRVRAAGRTVSHYAVGDFDVLRRPRRDRAGDAEIDVVGMRGHDEHAGRFRRFCHDARRSNTTGITLVVCRS